MWVESIRVEGVHTEGEFGLNPQSCKRGYIYKVLYGSQKHSHKVLAFGGGLFPTWPRTVAIYSTIAVLDTPHPTPPHPSHQPAEYLDCIKGNAIGKCYTPYMGKSNDEAFKFKLSNVLRPLAHMT